MDAFGVAPVGGGTAGGHARHAHLFCGLAECEHEVGLEPLAVDAERVGHAALLERPHDAAAEAGFCRLQHDGLRGDALVPGRERVGERAVAIAADRDVAAWALSGFGSVPIGQRLGPSAAGEHLRAYAFVGCDGVAQRLGVSARRDEARGVHPRYERRAAEARALVEAAVAPAGCDDVLQHGASSFRCASRAFRCRDRRARPFAPHYNGARRPRIAHTRQAMRERGDGKRASPKTPRRFAAHRLARRGARTSALRRRPSSPRAFVEPCWKEPHELEPSARPVLRTRPHRKPLAPRGGDGGPLRRRAALPGVRGALRRVGFADGVGHGKPHRAPARHGGRRDRALGPHGHRAAVRGHRACRGGRRGALGRRHHPVGRRQGRRGGHPRGRALRSRGRSLPPRHHRAAHHLRGTASSGGRGAGRGRASCRRAVLRARCRRRSRHRHRRRSVPLGAQGPLLGTRRACGRRAGEGRVGHRHGRCGGGRDAARAHR